MFFVKSFYDKRKDSNNHQNYNGPQIQCMLIWKNLRPYKVEILVWQAMQDRLATGSELLKHGIIGNELMMGLQILWWVYVLSVARKSKQLFMCYYFAKYPGMCGLI